MARPPVNKKTGITPLWIVAAFVSLTEITLGVVLTQVDGGVQVCLTVFVMVFPLFVATAFFAILWKKPWNFYAPSEYGNVDPKDFMSAIRDAPIVVEQLALAKTVEENPDDDDARFSLIDAMADEIECQWMILMHLKDIDLPRGGDRYAYEFRQGAAGMGTSIGRPFTKLEGTGLVQPCGSGRFSKLTKDGSAFAKRLIDRGRKADFFWCSHGSWGKPEPGGAVERWLIENDIQLVPESVPHA